MSAIDPDQFKPRGSGVRKATKDYKCKWCRKDILKGTVYYRLLEDPDDAGTPPFPGAYCNEECVGQAQFGTPDGPDQFWNEY
jgi:hypothetical protein